jgi:hypothetical protein
MRMSDMSAMRTGRLVVRYHAPWRRRSTYVIAGLVVLLLLYIAYEWGRFDGGYSKFAELQRRREFSAQLATLRADNEKLRAAVADAELSHEVDQKAYSDVEKTLADLQAQVLKHREELTFYRGIVSPEDGVGGLRIERFQVLPGTTPQQFRLRLVLVQSMRQEGNVAGAVTIVIEGTRKNQPAQLALNDAGGTTRADGLVPFQFRHFQNLEQDVTLPEDFEPRAVTVEVRATRLAPVRESYPWQVAAES